MKWFRVRKIKAETAGAMIGGAGGKTARDEAAGGAGAGPPKRNFFRKAGVVLLGTIFTGLVGTAATAQGGGSPAVSGGGREDINIPNATLTNNDGEGMASTLAQQPPRRAEAQKIDTVEKFRQVLLSLGMIHGTGDAEFNAALGKIGLSQRAILEGRGNASAIRLLNALNNYLQAKNSGQLDDFDLMDIRDLVMVNAKGISDYEERASLAEADFCVNSTSTECGGLASAIGELLKNDPGKVDEVTKMIFVMSTLDAQGKTVAPAQAIAGVETGISAIGGRQVSDPEGIIAGISRIQAEPVPSQVEGEEAGPPAPTQAPGWQRGKWEKGSDFPKVAQETDIGETIKAFEKSPTPAALENVRIRYEYLLVRQGEPISAEESGKIDNEIDQANKWLRKLGLWRKGEATVTGINRLKAGMETIQKLYIALSPEHNILVDQLRKTEATNKTLFGIYAMYLSLVDKQGANLFEGLKPGREGYLDSVEARLAQFFAAYDVRMAQAQWFTDYYGGFNPQKIALGSQMERVAYDKLAELEPLLAFSFAKYLERIKSAGLGSEAERQLVVETAVRLYNVNPLMVGKYFSALENLAYICEDNRATFEEAIARLSARAAAIAEPINSRMSPVQTQAINTRRIMTNLGNFLDAVSGLRRSTMAQWDMLNVWDKNLWVNPIPTHEIRGRPPGYIPQLEIGEEEPGTLGVAHMFANQYFPNPGRLVGAGQVSTNFMNYSGTLTLPTLRLLNISGGSAAQLSAMVNYIDPTHRFTPVSGYIPGVNISPLSPTKLLAAIDAAAIPTAEPEYGGPAMGGGGGGGFYGFKEDLWRVVGGTAGTVLTPTGGYFWGGSLTEEEVVGGAGVVAMPLGSVREVPSAEGGKTTPAGTVVEEPKHAGVAGVDSAIVGYEQTVRGEQLGFMSNQERENLGLSNEHKELLMKAIATNWTPDYPSQHFFSLSWKEQVAEVREEGEVTEATEKPKEVLLTRYFFVRKNKDEDRATIYELMGGKNEFLQTMNFAALYGLQPGAKGKTAPVIYAGNLEPVIERGGAAVAADIGKSAILGHSQEIPFLIAEEEGSQAEKEAIEKQPLLLQYRIAGSHTVEKGEKGLAIHQLAFPGQFLRLRRDGDVEGEGRYIEDKYFIQDGEYTLTRVKGESDAWELTFGAGAGYMEKGVTPDVSEPKEGIGRGGLFLKVKKPKHQVGGGAYYEGGATRFEEIGLMSEAEEAKRYIENLHRIGVTIYGSKERANGSVIGALGHGIEQLRNTIDPETGESSLEHDVLLGRLIGLAIGARAAGRVGFSRKTGLDSMMMAYQKLNSDIQENPAAAEYLIDNFTKEYSEAVMRTYDRYSLGATIKRNFSVELVIINREEENDFTSQWENIENIYGRMLLTWDTKSGAEGFWRAYAAVPIGGGYGTAGERVLGVIGTGVGHDLFPGMVLQRFAADVGLIAAQTNLHLDETGLPEWDMTAGVLAKGAMRLFSNVAEDLREYKRVEKEYQKYTELIRQGRFSQIDKDVRKRICDDLGKDPEKTVDEALVQTIRTGGDIYDENGVLDANRVTPVQKRYIEDALWRAWFAPKKDSLQKDFDVKWRLYAGGGAYMIKGSGVQWDIGMISDMFTGIAKLRAYAIYAQREVPQYAKGEITNKNLRGIYTGLDLSYKGFTAGAMVNVREDEEWGLSLSAGYGGTTPSGVPWNVSGVFGSHSTRTPVYAIPLEMRIPEFTGRPEISALIVFTLGAGAMQGMPILPPIMPEPGVMGTGGYQNP